MRIEFDPRKSRRNNALRGLSFELVAELDWDRAIIGLDDRRDYGEPRQWALAMGEGGLFKVVFTMSAGALRVISLRRASRKERRDYAPKA
jgi:uncharacterized DUF497 family protein